MGLRYHLQGRTQPLILYGQDARDAWTQSSENYSNYLGFNKRFYGDDTTITVPVPEATSTMDILANLPDTKFSWSVEAIELGGGDLKDIHLGVEGRINVTVKGKSLSSAIAAAEDEKVYVPVQDAEIIMSASNFNSFKTGSPSNQSKSEITINVPIQGAEIIMSIKDLTFPDEIVTEGTNVAFPVLVTADQVFTASASALGSQITELNLNGYQTINAPLPEEKMKFYWTPNQVTLWSCSTPDPNYFWELFLIRSEGEVVICLPDSEQ